MLWLSTVVPRTYLLCSRKGGFHAFYQTASSSGHCFTCNGLAVERVDTCNILGLGLRFHISGGILHRFASLKAKAARSWGLV